MDLIAKRKVDATWREALAARGEASGQSGAVTARFAALLAEGMPEAEAAYRALAAFDLLWPMTEPTEAGPDRD